MSDKVHEPDSKAPKMDTDNAYYLYTYPKQ